MKKAICVIYVRGLNTAAVRAGAVVAEDAASEAPRTRGRQDAKDQGLEPDAERHAEQPAAVNITNRPREVVVLCCLAEIRTRDVAGRQTVGVLRTVRIRSDGGIPLNELVIVQQVVELDLDPRPGGLPDRDAVGRREIEQPVPFEVARAAVAEKQVLR